MSEITTIIKRVRELSDDDCNSDFLLRASGRLADECERLLIEREELLVDPLPAIKGACDRSCNHMSCRMIRKAEIECVRLRDRVVRLEDILRRAVMLEHDEWVDEAYTALKDGE